MKCWFFFHDWHMLKSRYKLTIYKDTRNKGLNVGNEPKDKFTLVENYICLKCGKKIDNIQKYINQLLEEKARRDEKADREVERQEKAKELWYGP